MRVADLQSIRIKIASPEDIVSWSYGEVTKPETINYRNQKPEKDGLFCERIFGPEKDYECYCGKYRKIRYKGIVCDRCGVEVTKAIVRRERMGHIKLYAPVSHIWFLRGVPSRIGMVLDIPMQRLEKVIYFAAYIVTSVDAEGKKRIVEELNKEYKQKSKNIEDKDVLQELKQAKNKVNEELNRLKEQEILSEIEYHELSLKYGEIFEAGTGAEALRKIFEQVDLDKLVNKLEASLDESGDKTKDLRRLRFLRGMSKAGLRPEWMFLTVLPVLPPDLRPIVQLDGGRYASSDLNDLYRRVINRNNRLKYLLDIDAPEVIVRNEKRMLQEAVDALIDNDMRKGVTTQSSTGGRRLLRSLADMLKGKQGRFRQNLLGKRVDYSGRSVIIVGPRLQLDQCGLPKKMALELFKPFVISEILKRELSYNVRGASRLIEEETDEVWEILEEVVKGKVVLLNRAPTLHRLGIQGFHIVLIEGESIQLHPLVCTAFNADFDGDQMAVHLPLSDKAQKEAREIMLSSKNLLKPSTGFPVVSPTKDIVLGCYWLTGQDGETDKVFSSFQEAILAHEFNQVPLRALIKVRDLETTVGRILFNRCFPEDHDFINGQVNSKKMGKLVRTFIDQHNNEESCLLLDNIKNLGFDYATISGVSWGMDDLIIPEEKKQIIAEAEAEIEKIYSYYRRGLFSREEKSNKSIEVWVGAKSKIEKIVPKTLDPKGSIFSIIDSGSRGSWSQPVQMAGMKGLVSSPSGKTIELPVKSCFKEGFGVLEYFISTHGSRKGTVDTALRTATAGYLTRRLVDASHNAIILEEDCGDTEGLEIFRSEADKLDQDFSFKIVGRVVLEDIKGIIKKGDIIDWQKADQIIKAGIEKVKVRSPLTCRSGRGLCAKCYGWDMGMSRDLVKLGQAVGVIAAQAIGEPGTQLTMRTFHTGGVVSDSDITSGLPRVQEIFETRISGSQAVLAKIDGQVEEITPDGVIKVKSEKKTTEQDASGTILVKVGDKVERGQILSEGNIDFKDYFALHGENKTKSRIVNEIQGIYNSQGVAIHDKHVEVVVRQMFSRLKVKDRGDSLFLPGEIITNDVLYETNAELEHLGKKPLKAVSVMLGISNVALTTGSFLSSASFQETSRVLIKAAAEGQEDKLRGLKENVILGKLIPAGTGLENDGKEEEKN
jgi:DNA-directed RNA polymerase subunit beta'